jgi:hypothetical protein
VFDTVTNPLDVLHSRLPICPDGDDDAVDTEMIPMMRPPSFLNHCQRAEKSMGIVWSRSVEWEPWFPCVNIVRVPFTPGSGGRLGVGNSQCSRLLVLYSSSTTH